MGIALLLLLWRREEHVESHIESFSRAFAHVRWNWVVAAIAFNLLSALAGSLGWDTVVKQAMAPPHPRYRDVLSAFSVGLLGNIVLPGRVGEVTRIAVLARRLPGRHGVWATLVGTVVAYRLLDLLPTFGLIAYVLLFAPMPAWALRSLLVIGGIGAVLLILGVVSARRHERQPITPSGSLRRLAALTREGLGVLRAPLPAATATLYQSIVWLSQLLAVFATLRAFGLMLPISAAALLLVLVNVAILFPVWPGNVGLLQVAVALPLAGYGVDYGRGIAFGLAMQAIEVSVGLSLGLLCLAREGLSMATLKRIPAEGDAPHSAHSQPLGVKDG